MTNKALRSVIRDQAAHLGRKSVFRGASKQQTTIGGYVQGTEVHLDFLAKAGSGKENNVFCCPTELFVVFLHIEAVCINLILNTLKLILFLELHKKYSFFFC